MEGSQGFSTGTTGPGQLPEFQGMAEVQGQRAQKALPWRQGSSTKLPQISGTWCNTLSSQASDMKPILTDPTGQILSTSNKQRPAMPFRGLPEFSGGPFCHIHFPRHAVDDIGEPPLACEA